MPSLLNSLHTPPGLRCCYWHPEYNSECQPFLLEKAHTEQLSNPECSGVDSDQLFIDVNVEVLAAAARLQNVEGGELFKSPHIITSGLLSNGCLNHD